MPKTTHDLRIAALEKEIARLRKLVEQSAEMTKPLVFATSRSEYLAKELAARYSYPLGSVIRKKFPEGERHMRLETDPRDKNILLIAETGSDSSFEELQELWTMLYEARCAELNVLIPYFGGQRQDKPDDVRTLVTAKDRMDRLSTLPEPKNGVLLAIADAHNDGLPYFGAPHLHGRHLYCEDLTVANLLKAAEGLSEIALCTTDAGRLSWVNSLRAKMLEKRPDLLIEIVIVLKDRNAPGDANVMMVIGNPKGRVCIFFDDIWDTAGSLIKAASAVIDKKFGGKHGDGGIEARAVLTHGVCSLKGEQKLFASGLFTKAWVTNSHPKAERLGHMSKWRGKIEVVSLAPLINDWVNAGYTRLFGRDKKRR